MFRSNASRFPLGRLGSSLCLGFLSSLGSHPAAAQHFPASAPPQLIARHCPTIFHKIFIESCQESPPRGDFDPQIPHIISPIHTKVRQGERPVIRWQSVDRALPYEVRVIGPGVRMAPLVVEGNRWQYPATLPLEPETRYRVVVQQVGSLCLEECEADFTVLSDGEMATFAADWDRLSMEERREPLAVAGVFQRHELYADAIARLEQEVAAGAAVRDYHHFLGELYGAVGLYRRALVQYGEAQQFPMGPNEREVRAWLNVAIGLAHWRLGAFREALVAFEAAEVDGEVLTVGELASLRERMEMVRDRMN